MLRSSNPSTIGPENHAIWSCQHRGLRICWCNISTGGSLTCNWGIILCLDSTLEPRTHIYRMTTYMPLRPPSPNSGEHNDDVNYQSPTSVSPWVAEIKELRMPHCMMILACIVCVITTIVNVTALNSLISVARLESLPTKTSLEYPDPYVGLENAHLHDPSLLPPIYNFPRVLALINISDPSSVYLDLHHWASGFGMIYPNDRQFLVSSQISTVAQFRTLDFGMERCVLSLMVPSSSALQEARSNKTVTYLPATSLNIWRLKASGDIDRKSLSWINRPPRDTLLTTMSISPGQNTFESPEFHCPSRSLQNFELSCATPKCHLQFQQDMKEPYLALFLTQHANLLTKTQGSISTSNQPTTL